MLHIVLWKWVQPNFRAVYTDEHVNIIASMLRRFITRHEVQVHCVTDQPYGIDPWVKCHQLWDDFSDLPNVTGKHLPSCYRRLKLFDVATQQSLGFAAGDRICSLDLDSIIMQSLDNFFDGLNKLNPRFAGWGKRGTYHQTVYNGSFWSFIAGDETLQRVWSSFDPKTSPRVALTKGFLGSDQGWLSLNFVGAPGSHPIRLPDFASYPQEVRRTGIIDKRTCIVFFHGSRKPWHNHEYGDNPWIKKVWRVQ